jgi:hypothetical protein
MNGRIIVDGIILTGLVCRTLIAEVRLIAPIRTVTHLYPGSDEVAELGAVILFYVVISGGYLSDSLPPESMYDSFLAGNVSVAFDLEPCIADRRFKMQVLADFNDSRLRSHPVLQGVADCGKNAFHFDFKWSYISRGISRDTLLEISIECADGTNFSKVGSVNRSEGQAFATVDFGVVDVRCSAAIP